MGKTSDSLMVKQKVSSFSYEFDSHSDDKYSTLKIMDTQKEIKVMKRFDKTKSIKDGYYPIYANNAFTNVNIEDSINSMRNLQGFCACNNLASGRIAKLQGGYYFLTFDNKWERIGNSLREIPFKQLLNLKWK